MYSKNDFKDMFRVLSEDELIERGLGPLTEEAQEALHELLEERGLAGHALESRVADVRRSLVERSGVTNHCDYCGKSVLIQPVRRGAQKFCGERCSEESMLAARATTLAPDLVHAHAMAMKFGECPCCRVDGRIIEVRDAYHVVSLVWIYRYSETDQLCCRECGAKANRWAAAGCALTGWWSLYGLFSTPYVIVKNLLAAYRRGDETEPSPKLVYRAQLDLARRMLVVPDTKAAGIGAS
jgi:hypothetical protein